MNKEPVFTISGDQEILDNLVINIQTFSNDTGIEEYEIQTLLYKGNIYDLNLDKPKVIAYKIFVSLNDELIGESVQYDNAMRFYPQDHVNHIEIYRMNDESIKIFHVYDRKYLNLDFNLMSPNITTLKANKTFDIFIKDNNIDKNSEKYIFYKDVFFKNYYL